MKKISSWGNLEKISVNSSDNLNSSILSIGNLNSYGDACLPSENSFYDVKCTNKEFLSPNITMKDLINSGYFIYGVPGKSNVTLGGAVASDVHGKDSSWGGSFINNVEELELIIASGETIKCNSKLNSDIFFATIGGYGLTGVITGIKLKSTENNFYSKYKTKIKKGVNLDSLFNLFSNKNDEYSVAWIDLLSKDKKWILEISKPTYSTKNQEINIKNQLINELKIALPFIGENRFQSMNLINSIFYMTKKNNSTINKNIEDVLFPLGIISNTKNLSKQRKIIQIQFSIPQSNENKINELLELLIDGQKPILCSVKKMDKKFTVNNLSFVQKGWTFAVDFPYNKFDHNLIRKFYKKLIELGGKVYLAKDSTLNQEEFKEMYPNIQNWEQIVKSVDPDNIFQSKMSNRLGIKSG